MTSYTSWRDIAPMTQSERKAMPKKCLLDYDHLKYPICPKDTQEITCQGLKAAYKRAQTKGVNAIARKAQILGAIHCDDNNMNNRKTSKKKNKKNKKNSTSRKKKDKNKKNKTTRKKKTKSRKKKS
jgi:hypothetical protein